MSLLAKVLAHRAQSPAPRTELEGTQRITALPQAAYAGQERYSERLGLRGRSITLYAIQERALEAVADAQGLLAPIPVGEGKTFPALLAGTVLGAKFVLVLTKAKLVHQTREAYAMLREQFRVVPTRITSYAMLSKASGSHMLDDLAERWGSSMVVVCDEAHCLANANSARTRRAVRFARENPGVRWVMLSGTFLRHSVRDVAHLAEMALRERSPFPMAGVYRTRETDLLDAWAEVMDPQGQPAPEHWGKVAALRRWAGEDMRLTGAKRTASARKALAQRLRTCPGVVAANGEALGVSLVMTRLVVDVPETVQRALEVLKDQDLDPDGEFWGDDLSKARKGKELAAGFYYRWVWAGDPDEDWLLARREWQKACRHELASASRRDYDSPLLVAEQLERELAEGAPKRWIHHAWEDWKLQRHKPEPDTVPVWVDRYLLEAVVRFAKGRTFKSHPPVIWYQSRAVGEALREMGLVVYCAASPPPMDSVAHLCAAAIRAHGTGRNLQAWRNAILLEPPAGPWEQLLGRHHRQGQQADEVAIYYVDHCEPFHKARANALEAERFAADTGKERRRMLYAAQGVEVQL